MEQIDPIEIPTELLQAQLEISKGHPVLNRITIVEQVYHQAGGLIGDNYGSNYSRTILSDEQAYKRHSKLTEEWKSIDLGWTDECGVSYLIIANREGQKYVGGNPTPEVKQETEAKTILVSLRGDGITDMEIPFKESVRILPVSPSTIKLRSNQGTVQVTTVAIPK